jgi:hypothetical protein
LTTSQRIGWVGHVTHTGQRRNAVIVLLRKTAEKSPLGRPEHRWDNNIIDINGVLWERVWTGLIWLI